MLLVGSLQSEAGQIARPTVSPPSPANSERSTVDRLFPAPLCASGVDAERRAFGRCRMSADVSARSIADQIHHYPIPWGSPASFSSRHFSAPLAADVAEIGGRRLPLQYLSLLATSGQLQVQTLLALLVNRS